MAPNGVIGIIVPSSVLSNTDAIHIGTREIILKHFDLIAMVELGSGTFGKTGTPTVVMFLKRKSQRPEPAEHYHNRVEDYFEGIDERDPSTAEYQDNYLINKYCEQIDVPVDEYKKLFRVSVDTISELDKLLKTDLFSDYIKDFESSTEIKHLKRQRAFKGKSAKDKAKELNKHLIKYLFVIEKDKLYYFMLAYKNPQKVLIVKSPTNTKKQKQFLGYGWSGAKGSEGIQYTGGNTVNDIVTPLFDPNNLDNPSKISALIKQNFLGNEPSNLEGLDGYKELISYNNVADILDFSRVDFNKSFSLSPKKNIVIDTNWRLKNLGKVAAYSTEKVDLSGISIADYITTDNLLQNRRGVTEYSGEKPNIERITKYQKNDILVSNIRPYLKKIWFANKNGGCSNDVLVLRSNEPSEFLPKYLFYILSQDIFFEYVMSGKKGIKMPRGDKGQIIQFPTPVPSKDIQEKLINECEVIDEDIEKAQTVINKAQKDIERGFNDAFKKSKNTFRLNDSDLFEVSIGKRLIAKEVTEQQQGNGIPVYSANVFEPFGYIEKQLLTDFSKPSVLWGIDGDWMVNYIDKDKPFYPTDHCGVLRVKTNQIHPRYLSLVLKKEGTAVRFSRSHRASIDRIKGITIKAPSIDLQNQLATKIIKLEKEIEEAEIIINNAPQQKQAIMDKYLK